MTAFDEISLLPGGAYCVTLGGVANTVNKGEFVPTIMRSGPYRLFFYSNEGVEPAHIHVQRERSLAKFWLKPVSLASAKGFSSTELREIQRRVHSRRLELLEAWNGYFKAR